MYGRRIELAATAVPECPSGAIDCASIRRFKGIKRPVIVLCELAPADKGYERLLSVGGSRAKQHPIVVVASSQGRRAVDWYRRGAYTLDGNVFDIGNATRSAIEAIEAGTPAATAGGTHQYASGNGSLMRILPIALVCRDDDDAQLVERARSASRLELDARHIRDVDKIDTFLLLVEDLELPKFGVPDFVEVMAAGGIEVRRLPIVDGDVPTDFAAFRATLAVLRRRLDAGQVVGISCRGGLGRTGTTVACLLIDAGLHPEAAIKLTRSARKGTIETAVQERFVRSWAS